MKARILFYLSTAGVVIASLLVSIFFSSVIAVYMLDLAIGCAVYALTDRIKDLFIRVLVVILFILCVAFAITNYILL